jgi:hypothetical protein
MNGQNIPADAWCATCRWFRAIPLEWRSVHTLTDGVCYVAPPTVLVDEHGVPISERPYVEEDDVCAQWSGVP